MAFGQSRYADYNELLNKKFAEKKMLICAHRGSWHGNIVQNTTLAYKAALMQGADILETDTTASADNVVFAYHDGREDWVFGWTHGGDRMDRNSIPNATEMMAEQIGGYYPTNALGEPSTHRIQPLTEVLEYLCHGELLNIDRTWKAKGLVLEIVDRYPYMRRQAILKAPLRFREVIDQMENHPVKYMFMPICHKTEDIEEILQYRELNIVGMELVANSASSPLFSKDIVDYIHSKGLFCWVNALTLTDIVPEATLFGGLDDDISIIEGPAAGWGRLMDMGFDVIQTDWPDLLRQYRLERLGIV
ncbi:MAG: glycerophosphodiester phosphodiesterase family protein [Anaerolineaceae bacterium]|nr:glycerophosphodiester phosphodiesterase family protein [Anaerolineaceae bacterium]